MQNAKMGRSVTYCALLGSSEKQWESANPRYRIFALSNETPYIVSAAFLAVSSLVEAGLSPDCYDRKSM